MDQKPRNKPTINWDAVQVAYRAGALSLRAIAAEHNCTEGAIRKRAKVRGWPESRCYHASTLADRSVPVPQTLPDPRDGAGYVYCIRITVGADHWFKVGLSVSPDVRAAAHQTSLPFDATICIAYFVPNMRKEELALHQAFASKHVRGEWFTLGDDELDLMASRARLA